MLLLRSPGRTSVQASQVGRVMLRRSPLSRKRAVPRKVHPERVQHGRIKRPITDRNAFETFHMGRLKQLPCCVSKRFVGSDGRGVVVHHLQNAPGKRCRRDHNWTVPLLDELHRNDSKIGVHGLGTEAKFEEHHNLAPGFLVAEAVRLREESLVMRGMG